jgi:glycosyltransferase involved in cell wall biosynthesis
MSRPLATVIQEQVYAYRVPFFRHLRDELDARGIDFRLGYDHARSACHDLDGEPWSVHTPTRRLGKVTWQSLGPACRGSGLVIFQQQVRYPANLLELLLKRLRGRKVAFWGHGKCFAEGWEERPGEKFKAWVSRHVDWWFAYNGRSADVVRALGYPAERITTVMNAVDTRRMAARRAELKEEDLQALREKLGIHSENVCVYTGTLHGNKRLDFLIEAAVEIRRRIADFELLVIGSGPDEARIRAVAAPYPWIRFLGRKDDVEKVPYWALSKLLLMPGLVGLVVIDSFALGVPLVTTEFPTHSHEIEYLRHGENGWISGDWQSVDGYAAAVVRLLEDEELRDHLSRGALADGRIYTVENMAKRFADGIRSALS